MNKFNWILYGSFQNLWNSIVDLLFYNSYIKSKSICLEWITHINIISIFIVILPPIICMHNWKSIFNSGPRRQERSATFPCQQLSIDNQSEAVHMHNADETWRRLESNPIQSKRFYTTCLRNKLRWDIESSNTCKL